MYWISCCNSFNSVINMERTVKLEENQMSKLDLEVQCLWFSEPNSKGDCIPNKLSYDIYISAMVKQYESYNIPFGFVKLSFKILASILMCVRGQTTCPSRRLPFCVSIC